MSYSSNQALRLRTLIIARLFVAAFLLFCVQYISEMEPIVFYAIISFISVLSVLYLAWWLSGKQLRFLAHLQIIFDLLWESVLIYYTGGVDSLFAPIYILSILSATFVLSPVSSFYIATGSALSFVGVILLSRFKWAPENMPILSPHVLVQRDPIYMFYAGYVRVTVFFVVAILAYYFSRVIQHLEDKVRNQERLVFLGEVTSSIAHEIRNPLTSISGSVELLAGQLQSKLSDTQKHLMHAVVDESDRIKRIFSGLLDYSRVLDLRMENVELSHFLDQVMLLMRHQSVFQEEVFVRALYKGKMIKANIDPEYMKQVLMNVITNAYQAMPNGGELTIDAVVKKQKVTIVIEDNGFGMDKKTLSALFVPFKTTKPDGAGLGMAQSYKIVSQHGGKIKVESKEGKGTRVEIILPMSG